MAWGLRKEGRRINFTDLYYDVLWQCPSLSVSGTGTSDWLSSGLLCQHWSAERVYCVQWAQYTVQHSTGPVSSWSSQSEPSRRESHTVAETEQTAQPPHTHSGPRTSDLETQSRDQSADTAGIWQLGSVVPRTPASHQVSSFLIPSSWQSPQVPGLTLETVQWDSTKSQNVSQGYKQWWPRARPHKRGGRSPDRVRDEAEHLQRPLLALHQRPHRRPAGHQW